MLRENQRDLHRQRPLFAFSSVVGNLRYRTWMKECEALFERDKGEMVVEEMNGDAFGANRRVGNRTGQDECLQTDKPDLI